MTPGRKATLRLLATALATALGASVAAAGDENGDVYPRLDVEVDVEIEYDGAIESDDPETHEVFTLTEPAITFTALPGLTFEAGLVLEPVEDLMPGEDRFFGDHGFYVEQLLVRYEQDEFSVFGGKFNPTFGVAWDIAPGIFGTEIGEDFYEQVERIGFGGSLTFGGDGIGGPGFGTHRLTGQTYFADTSFLSESAITNRGDVDLSDGGPANTESLESFSITLDGTDFIDGPGSVSYSLGLVRNAEGVTETEDEVGISAALYGSFEIDEHTAIEPLIEFVHFDGAEGVDQDRDILTAGGALLYDQWNLALVYSGAWSDPNAIGIEDVDVTLFQATAGYSFDFGLDVDAGYKYIDEEVDGVSTVSHFVGVLLHYAFGFSIPD